PSSHHPSWLAKRAVAVDHLAGGRLDLRLAVGAEDSATAAAWRSHAIPYPDAPTRVALAAETIEILERLWTGEAVDYDGRFYALRGDRKSTRLNSSHVSISYAVFCLHKKAPRP